MEEYTSRGMKELIMSICWNICKARNEAVFKDSSPRPEVVISKATRLYKDFIKKCFELKNDTSTEACLEQLHVWTRPPSGFLKINIDASFKLPSRWAGGGLIARDERDDLVEMQTCRFMASSPLMVEAYALRKACFWAKEKEWNRIIFQSDNKELIDLCSNKTTIVSWEIEAIIVDVGKLKDGMNWRFKWDNRSTNLPAHCLACYARENGNDVEFSVWPDQLWSLLLYDLA